MHNLYKNKLNKNKWLPQTYYNDSIQPYNNTIIIRLKIMNDDDLWGIKC